MEALAAMGYVNASVIGEDFGTHSFRKGVASYVAGVIGGPGIVAIFLRAGWSLGQVLDR